MRTADRPRQFTLIRSEVSPDEWVSYPKVEHDQLVAGLEAATTLLQGLPGFAAEISRSELAGVLGVMKAVQR